MTITMYGIRNCDTVKRARIWLGDHQRELRFVDFKAGVPADRLDAWVAEFGWERLLNRKGNTWRKLEPAEQASVVDAASAKRLMLAHGSVIKRPVVEWADGAVTIGFDAQDWVRR